MFDRAQRVTLEDNNLSEERKHLHRVLNANGYPKRFINSATAPTKKSIQEEQDWVPRSTITIPYVAGASEEIKRICRSFDVRVAFRMAGTIHSELMKVKDPLPLKK